MSYTIYSKEKCPFCIKAKDYLSKRGLSFTVFTLGEDFTVDEIREKFPDAKTFPIIVEDGRMIGGYKQLTDHLG